MLDTFFCNNHRPIKFAGCFFAVLLLFYTVEIVGQESDSIPIHQSFTVFSTHLNEQRTINVWCPENYNPKIDSLPVLYMLDGGLKEDFPHLANTVSDLVKKGRIEPVILVGIENTQRHRDLTGDTKVEEDKLKVKAYGGSQRFRAFIKDELFPEIRSRYNTRSSRSIIGESLAGLFIIETFFVAPNMFDNYICFDPSLWWNNHQLIDLAKEVLPKTLSSEKKLWFASSSEPLIAPYTKRLADFLSSCKVGKLKWKFEFEPNEQHNTIFKAKKAEALIWLYKKSNK